MQSGQTSLTTGQTGRHIMRQRDQRYGNRQVGGATVMYINVLILCFCFVFCFKIILDNGSLIRINSFSL